MGTPPALRFLWYLTWRAIRERLYEAHKTIVLWRTSRCAVCCCSPHEVPAANFLPFDPRNANVIPNCCAPALQRPRLMQAWQHVHWAAHRRALVVQWPCGDSTGATASLASCSIWSTLQRCVQAWHGMARHGIAWHSMARVGCQHHTGSVCLLMLLCAPPCLLLRLVMNFTTAAAAVAAASFVVSTLQTGRVHMLPPVRRPLERPTFFFVF